MAAEISITVKNEEKTLKTDHLVYDDFVCNEDDPLLKSLIDETVKQFNSEVENIKIRITITVK